MATPSFDDEKPGRLGGIVLAKFGIWHHSIAKRCALFCHYRPRLGTECLTLLTALAFTQFYNFPFWQKGFADQALAAPANWTLATGLAAEMGGSDQGDVLHTRERSGGVGSWQGSSRVDQVVPPA